MIRRGKEWKKLDLLTLKYFFNSGNLPETRGTAFVVYEDIFDAKNACEHLSGFNVSNRYLVVLYTMGYFLFLFGFHFLATLAPF